MKTFQDGDPVFGVMMNAIANLWPNGTAVLSGCTPTGSGAARQVTVAAGTVVINGTVRSVSQQTETLDAATFDRYDLISVNTSGTVVVTKGTEERRVPALPANSVPIAICLVETGQTTLPADRIYDSRMDALRLSVLNIDADKDWNGKSITNVNLLSAVKLKTTTWKLLADPSRTSPCYESLSSVSTTSGTWVTLKTAPPVPAGRSGAVHIHYVAICNPVSAAETVTAHGRVLLNGVVIPGSEASIATTAYDGIKSVSGEVNIAVTTGDVITVQGYLDPPGLTQIAYISGFGIYAHLQPILDGTVSW